MTVLILAGKTLELDKKVFIAVRALKIAIMLSR